MKVILIKIYGEEAEMVQVSVVLATPLGAHQYDGYFYNKRSQESRARWTLAELFPSLFSLNAH